jgi:hypothetical protein
LLAEATIRTSGIQPKKQIAELLNKPGLYQKLSPILSVSNIESNEINEKAEMLRQLLISATNL